MKKYLDNIGTQPIIFKAFRQVLLLLTLAVGEVSFAQNTIGGLFNSNACDLVGQYTTTAGFTPNYTQGTTNNANGSTYELGLSAPQKYLIDAVNHRAFVAETGNNRVLVFNLDASDNVVDKTPDFVLGQTSFTTNATAVTQAGLSGPFDLAYDAVGNRLFVANSTANRVTVYDVATITNGENAINVLGQSSFTTSTAAATQAGMNTPSTLAYDATNNRLFVGQEFNSRVTVFDVSSITNGENAVNVLGQTSFTTNFSGAGQAMMSDPSGLAYDATNNRLFVGDRSNNRVLVFDVASITNGENAINVLGQVNFTTTTTATTQAGLAYPRGLAYDDANQRLFVSQTGFTTSIPRVTVFDVASITNGENAVDVLGQPDYTTVTVATTQTSTTKPSGLTYDAVNQKLYVAQTSSANRISVFCASTPPPTATATQTNVLCKSASTGAIDLTVTDGTAPYTYLWSNSTTTQDLTGIPAGTYSVTVTDATSATATHSVTITEPTTALSGTASVSGSSATITATGGTSPYQYKLDAGAYGSTNVFTGLSVGSHTVVIRDANLCTFNRIFTVASALTANATASNISCSGSANGAISLTVTGGTSPYTYNWGGGITTKDRTGLAAGTYTVTVTDAAVATQTASATITEPDVLNVARVRTQPTCSSSGAINITAVGGTAPYSYDWGDVPGSVNAEDRAGLIGGSYPITVTDVNGCKVSSIITLTAPICAPTYVTVCKSNAADVFSVAPNPDITIYTWTVTGGGTIASGQGTPSVSVNWTAATVGTGTVCCKTVNSCGESVNTCQDVYIRGPIAGASVTPPTCVGSNILLSGSGGVTYRWTGPSSFTANSETPIINNATAANAGTYNVTVTDESGCTATASVVVTVFTTPTATATTTNASCGVANGAITLTPASGTSPYTYAWSNGATTQNLSSILAGAYVATVTDNNGCKVFRTVNVGNNSAQTVSLAATNVACFGGITGQLTPSVSGGVAPFTYFWSNGATTTSLTGLAIGTYQVTVTGADGCTGTASATLTQPNEILVNSAITNVNCVGNATGAINVTVTGGATPYTYNWGGGVTSEDRTGLTGGVYTVTVTDANGCTVTNTSVVSQPSSPLIAATAVTNVKCNGGATGIVNLTASGGTLPYTYLWTDGATAEDISNKSAGLYSVTVTDAKGCTVTGGGTVNEPAVIGYLLSITSVSCNGGNNGAINLTPSGGTLPLSILWSNGATTEDLSGLTAGTYGVTITDANACTASTVRTVTQRTALVVSATPINPTCNDGINGAIGVAVAGGRTPYTYSWSNGSTVQSLSGVAAGTYILTVTDANSCTIVTQTTLTEPTAILLTGSVTNVKCFNESTGAIALTVTNGVGALTYDWGGGITTQNRTALVTGNYTVTVTDANSCTATRSFTVDDAAPPLGELAIKTNVTCNGNADGAFRLNLTGGTLPYTFIWSNGATTQNISSLVAGNYAYTVSDAVGCVIIGNFTINEPAAIVLSATTVGASCNGGKDGSINLTVSGGNSPFRFNWSNGATTEDITGITAGNYNVTVTGANGCGKVLSNIAISEMTTLTITPTITNNLCRTGSKGAIALTIAGGTAPFTYSWSNGATTKDITGLAAGNYTLVVRDAANCVNFFGFAITEPPSGSALILSTVTTPSNCGAATGAVDLTATGGTTPYSYAWSNSATTQDILNVSAATYSVSVTDASGCIETTSNLVNNVSAPSVSPVVNNVSCKGGTNGSINPTVTGGTAPYTYSWSNGTSAAILTGVGAGTYTVTVTGANGCRVITTNTLTEPAESLSLTTAKNAPNCTGTGGEAFASPSGGTAPYTYLWSNSATTSSISNLSPATYTVTATDSKGCTANLSVIITAADCQPPVAVNDNFTTPLNTPITQTVAPNDSDPDGLREDLVFTLLTFPTFQQGRINFDTYGNFTFTPITGFTGTIPLNYRVCDATNLCTTAILTINVTAAVTPVTESGTSPSTGGTPIVNVRSNDTVNGSAATSSNSTISQVGTWQSGITLNTTTGAITVANGTTPGVYSVTYQLCDLVTPTANCATVADTITVTAACNAGTTAPILIKN